jgi:8-oxo-dGTP pyrophosphatase MutT (NUDIX family)
LVTASGLAGDARPGGILIGMLHRIWRRRVRPRIEAVRRPPWPGRPGPFTPRVPLGAAALIRDAEGRVLLIHQSYQRPPMWLPPGGWVDRGETPRQAACREVWEELGLRVEVGRALATRGGGYGEVAILFECRRLDDAPFRLSDEILRAEFFRPEALPPMADIVRACLTEALVAGG